MNHSRIALSSISFREGVTPIPANHRAGCGSGHSMLIIADRTAADHGPAAAARLHARPGGSSTAHTGALNCRRTCRGCHARARWPLQDA